MQQKIAYLLTGTAPVRFHNGVLMDPLSEAAKGIKKISGKRNKTDADYEEIGKLEWYGSLYVDGGRVVIPDRCVEATLINGAKKSKKGIQAKAGMLCDGHAVLQYDGPHDIDELWEDKRFVARVPMRVKNSGVIRTLPHFASWKAEVRIVFDDKMLNATDIDSFLVAGGEIVGICEGRPRFGRFTSSRIK